MYVDVLFCHIVMQGKFRKKKTKMCDVGQISGEKYVIL